MVAKAIPRAVLRLRLAQAIARKIGNKRRSNFSSGEYWENRYAAGGSSGRGSYGSGAENKARFVNTFVEQNGILSVIEFGCGDGNQLSHATYPAYLGLDVSPAAVESCRDRFRDDASKRFVVLDEYSGETADLALSLDVVYHLVEYPVFEHHLRQIFSAANRFVIVYSTNVDRNGNAPHVLHREFVSKVEDVAEGWHLIDQPTFEEQVSVNPFGDPEAGFFVFEAEFRTAGVDR